VTADPNFTYKYDAWNRLAEVRKRIDGSLVAAYRYDPPSPSLRSGFGGARGVNRRIAKLLPNGQNWKRTDFFYDEAWQVVEERYNDSQADSNAVATATKAKYVWDIRYIDAPVVRWWDQSGDGDFDEPNEVLYYCGDFNVNVTALVDPDGNVVERYQYDPYGKVTVLDGSWNVRSSGSAYANEILYCGYRYDPETGNYDVRHRKYLPFMGCWAQVDLGRYLDGMNPYQYVRLGPITAVDPYGDRIFFVKRKKGEQLSPPKQGPRPNQADEKYRTMTDRAKAAQQWMEDQKVWNKGKLTEENIITMHVLLRYSVAKDGSVITPEDLTKIAAEHKTILEDAINNANYTYIEGAREWKVKANVIITTNEASSHYTYRAQLLTLSGKELSQEMAKYKVYGEYGAYTKVDVTCKTLNEYNLHLVPAHDPKWDNITFRDILAHELIAHGMNNSDEEDRGNLRWRTALENRLGGKVPSDSIMTYDKSPSKRFYQRHWEAGFEEKSNIPGVTILGGNTSNLDVSDPWFSEGARDDVVKQGSLNLVQEIIRASRK
jgi:RHS repeat-associated protein